MAGCYYRVFLRHFVLDDAPDPPLLLLIVHAEFVPQVYALLGRRDEGRRPLTS
jgi:hypothetical protein